MPTLAQAGVGVHVLYAWTQDFDGTREAAVPFDLMWVPRYTGPMLLRSFGVILLGQRRDENATILPVCASFWQKMQRIFFSRQGIA